MGHRIVQTRRGRGGEEEEEEVRRSGKRQGSSYRMSNGHSNWSKEVRKQRAEEEARKVLEGFGFCFFFSFLSPLELSSGAPEWRSSRLSDGGRVKE